MKHQLFVCRNLWHTRGYETVYQRATCHNYFWIAIFALFNHIIYNNFLRLRNVKNLLFENSFNRWYDSCNIRDLAHHLPLILINKMVRKIIRWILILKNWMYSAISNLIFYSEWGFWCEAFELQFLAWMATDNSCPRIIPWKDETHFPPKCV